MKTPFMMQVKSREYPSRKYTTITSQFMKTQLIMRVTQHIIDIRHGHVW